MNFYLVLYLLSYSLFYKAFYYNQGDNLKQFGWNKHDGVNFGIQTIIDRSVNITTSFVKTPGGTFGGDWSNRIDVKPLQNSKKSSSSADDMEIGLLYYVALDGGVGSDARGGAVDTGDSKLLPVYADDGSLSEIRGNSPSLGSWRLWWKVDFYYIHFIIWVLSS